jgi:hypothetical protein
LWLPAARPAYDCGLVQLANADASRLQAKLLPASVEVNVKLALELLVGLAGCDVIVVFGATVSTVKPTLDEPLLLAASVAATTTVWAPSPRPE